VFFTREYVVPSGYLSRMDERWFKRQQKVAGVTADAIAATLGRDRSAVSRIYSGKQRMTLEWAQAFATALKVPVATVLEKAGATTPAARASLSYGMAEGDAAPWAPPAGSADPADPVGRALGAGRPGVDVWRVRSRAMALAGLLAGDWVVVDTHAAERTRAGDTVIAQVYDNARGTATTLLRRHEPPVLVAASIEPDDQRALVVDGVNVVIRGKVIASWRGGRLS
jgi:hypothetical protein